MRKTPLRSHLQLDTVDMAKTRRAKEIQTIVESENIEKRKYVMDCVGRGYMAIVEVSRESMSDVYAKEGDV